MDAFRRDQHKHRKPYSSSAPCIHRALAAARKRNDHWEHAVCRCAKDRLAISPALNAGKVTLTSSLPPAETVATLARSSLRTSTDRCCSSSTKPATVFSMPLVSCGQPGNKSAPHRTDTTQMEPGTIAWRLCALRNQPLQLLCCPSNPPRELQAAGANTGAPHRAVHRSLPGALVPLSWSRERACRIPLLFWFPEAPSVHCTVPAPGCASSYNTILHVEMLPSWQLCSLGG